MDAIARSLWLAWVLLAGLLAVKLFRQGLARTYRRFTAYLCFDIARSTAALPLRQDSTSYAWVFIITQPATWLLYILIVLELYSVALRGRRGIVTLSQWALSISLGVAVAVSALTLWADLQRPPGRYPVLVYYSVIERGLISSLALFLLLITAFLNFFPLPVTRNIRLHTATFTLYFLATTMALFLQNVAGYDTAPGVDAILMLIAVVCFALWLGGLNRAGETSVSVRGTWQPEDEERLMRHLDALNAAVHRTPKD